ncbi:MAG: hypothetical protein ABIS18_02135 [Actinomycetota bacterium]
MDTVERVAEILLQAGETHHMVYQNVDGDDPDWASWYADWLINLSELPQVLGAAPIRSELVYLLVGCGKEFADGGGSGRWEEAYAKTLVEKLSR